MVEEQFESDLDEKAFDDPSTEPIERLPRLAVGEYTLKIDNTVHRKGASGEYFIVEVTVLESSGEKAAAVGSRASYMIKLDVSGFAKKYMARRVKGFVYTITGRRGIEGRELIQMLRQPELFTGKAVNANVEVQVDDEGDPKLSDEGEPYTEVTWSAVPN